MGSEETAGQSEGSGDSRPEERPDTGLPVLPVPAERQEEMTRDGGIGTEQGRGAGNRVARQLVEPKMPGEEAR